jgi:predicted glutamine amidotransferase
MIKAEEPRQPAEILRAFASMSQRSRAFDGDWQGDGWGVGWISAAGVWDTRKSIRPIWEESALFDEIPESRFVVAHSRSASFPHHKGVPDYTQPFLLEPYAFVFNGFLQGVSLPATLPGTIGSQKIWALLNRLLRSSSPEESIARLKEILQKNSRFLQALNIGLCDKRQVFAFCYYTRYGEYYNLHRHDSSSLQMVSSEPLRGWDFRPVAPGEVLSF